MNKLAAQVEREAERDALLTSLTAAVPYNRLLGVSFDRRGDELTARLPFRPKLVGNPILPAIHGGVTGSFLEICAMMQLAWDLVLAKLEQGAAVPADVLPQWPKTIDITVDYLRSGRARDCFARAHVQKSGRRVAHVHVEAWQDERGRPIAMLRGNFLMPSDRAG